MEKTMTREFRLGLFIVVTLLILGTGVFLIGGRSSWFRGTYRVKAAFPNAAGLDPGAEVRVGGVHEGTVVAINLPKHAGESVTVEMNLNNATRDVVKRDSVALIRPEGLLGDKYVEVSFGSKDAESLRGGETINSEPPLDFSDLIKKADQILDSANATAEDAQAAATSAKSIASKIDQGQGTVGALINDKTIYQQAEAGVTSLRENMEALKHNFLVRGFFKKRGYEDSDELTKHEIPRLPAEPPLKTFAYDPKRMFGQPDSAKLKNQKVLNDAGSFLEGGQFGLAVVTASAGMKGDSDKDQQLTEAQAMNVRDYLVQNFRLDDTRIKTLGLGKSKAAGESAGVEILIYPPADSRKESAREMRNNPAR
jgi:phospholipid/cholesterol/gamma-HCH transport system substrate-binding protein